MHGVACPASNITPEEGVSVACYNSASHVTLAVNSEAGLRYLDTLQKQGLLVLNLFLFSGTVSYITNLVLLLLLNHCCQPVSFLTETSRSCMK